MAIIKSESDRHKGIREHIWFGFDEHSDMLKGMELIKETNKSNYIRSSVKYFTKVLKEKVKEIK